MHTITLTTDFGTRDWFVGAMKGVILSIAPRVRVVDITHEVQPGDVWAGAFALAASWRCFPPATVHVAVVDPGVGSARRALVVETDRGWFVGPDNGVLTLALADQRLRAVRALENRRYFRAPVSATFHGRDVFAPVAAHLSRGVAVRNLGPAVGSFVRLPWPEPSRKGRRVTGRVVYVDRFGNAITNLPAELAPHTGRGPGGVVVAGKHRCPVRACYQAVPLGRPVAVPGSAGYLEVAVNGGSGAQTLGVAVGDPVVFTAAG